MTENQVWVTRNGFLVELENRLENFWVGRFLGEDQPREVSGFRHTSTHRYVWDSDGRFETEGESEFDLVCLAKRVPTP